MTTLLSSLVSFSHWRSEEAFPGGYTGRDTAIISSVFIFFTLIGYCGVSVCVCVIVAEQLSSPHLRT